MKLTPYRLQKLTVEDADLAFELVTQIYSQYKNIGGEWSRERVDEELNFHSGACLYLNEAPAAIALFQVTAEFTDLHFIGIDSQYRQQGWVRLLLQLIVEEWGTQKFLAEVHEANLVALKFYEKMGFQKIAVRSRYYRDGASASILERVWAADISPE